MKKRQFLASVATGAIVPASVQAVGRAGNTVNPSATGAQGGAPLHFGINVLTPTPGPGYSVTLPVASGSGQTVEVITRSVYFVTIFPPRGSYISFFDINIGYGIYPGTYLSFRDVAPFQWDMLFNLPSNYPVLVGIKARAGGGQPGATPMTYGSNVIAVVQTAGDSVLLPHALGAGAQCFITNHGAASCDIFPRLGENMNMLPPNIPYSLPAGKAAMFVDIGPPNQWDGGAFV